MRYRVKTKLGLLLLSVIVAAVAFIGAYEMVNNSLYQRWREEFDNEGWFGALTIPSPNPVLMWEYRPNGEVEEIKTNRHGFRDLDYESTAKPDDTFRVAFAGDSITLGMGVRLEDTFARQFELEANRTEAQIRVQALSFAVDGYNTPQIAEMVRTKVLSFSPDKVVYMMCLNDFDFAESAGHKILYFRKPRSFFLWTIENAYLRWSGVDFHRYHFRKTRKMVFQSILDMRRMLEEDGKPRFQLVLLPIFPANFDDYSLRDVHERIRTFLEENGIQFLDLLDAFSETGELSSRYAFDIWHPNVEGHRFIAQQLVPSVFATHQKP